MKHTTNPTMMQYFEWYFPPNCELWNTVAKNAGYLYSIGITSVWLPPAYKAAGGVNDTGYAVYDLYDLGEFDQKGAIPTKYGTKEEYLNAIKILKGNNVEVIADVVFNHRMGADEKEEVIAIEDDSNNRNTELGSPKSIQAWTKFYFPARNGKYSDFTWNWTYFHGVDWDDIEKKCSVYKFYGKVWDKDVDTERGNYDYLMGADVDLNNVDVTNELKTWGKWYLETANVDGFRLDAVKHIRSSFFEDWISYLREIMQKDFFAVGEYWSSDVSKLNNYIKDTKELFSLFDVPLHYHLYEASNNPESYDMRNIFENTLVKCNPDLAVTFVDNHDTETGQPLDSFVQAWFKPLAYSLILLRKGGYPCVFYGDYYGIPYCNIAPMTDILESLLKARNQFAYGEQIDYFDDFNIIGWIRTGDYDHVDSGMAVLVSNGHAGCKQMNVGKKLSNCILYDYTGNIQESVYVDQDGNGIFYVKEKSISVWVKKETILK